MNSGILFSTDKEIVNSNMGLFSYSMEVEKLESCDFDLVKLQELQNVIKKFEKIFVLPNKLPPQREHDHHIPLVQGSKPPNIRPYHYGSLQKIEIEKAIQELLDARFIRQSHNPFSFLVLLLVRKKEGTLRMFIDYKELNALTIKDKYLIALIDAVLDELHGSIYFSKTDLRPEYHQILMKLEGTEETIFRTHERHYEFLVIPFRLTNAPATFQSLMNDLFKPHLRKFVLVFFDEILIYNKT